MIRGIKIVSIPVSDQDRALKFYTEKMGFKVATDQAFGPGQRWIELLIPGSDVNLALFTPPWPREPHWRISARDILVRRCVCNGKAAQVEGRGAGRGTEEGGLGNHGQIQRS
jgi:catechol 2,3-dioxygenase-like lactoylglutathione lyase family enzyme